MPLRLLGDDFLTLVVATVVAYTVVEVHFTTVGALGQAGCFQLPVATASLVSACAGNLLLRYCHDFILLSVAGQIALLFIINFKNYRLFLFLLALQECQQEGKAEGPFPHGNHTAQG